MLTREVALLPVRPVLRMPRAEDEPVNPARPSLLGAAILVVRIGLGT